MDNGNANASTNPNLRPWDNGIYDFGNSSYNNFGCPSSSLAVHLQTQQQTQLQHYHLPQQQNHHHLTCLNLGKRPCYREDKAPVPEIQVAKRDKQLPLPLTSLPRCQVEGCNRSLSEAKEYHRRHKVCELHSKAPCVTVQGAEQRFCQQCSRFHVISEFDDAKRSCRRRLAGHNERRRKSNAHESIMRNSIHSLAIGGAPGQTFPNVPTSPGRALSLLSSKVSPWGLTPDLSSRSSAALYELISENRAAVLTRQICSDRAVWLNTSDGANLHPPHQLWPHQIQVTVPSRQLADSWTNLNDANGHVTLDLMQAPGNSLERVVRNDEEDCSEIWKSLEGTHVV